MITGPGGSDPDVVVVGGGPAGAVSAFLLARRGRRVVVVEREAFPRAKPCGDCLSAAATELLREIGLLRGVIAAGAARLAGWRIVSPAGHASTGEFGGSSALALERRRLDTVLLEAAAREGVVVLRGKVQELERARRGGRITGVQVREPGGEERTITAGLVVGADGLRSVVARRAGLIRRRPRLRKVSLTTHGSGPAGRMSHGEMHVLDGACFGLAPAGRGRFNVTLVVPESQADALAAVGPEDFFDQWLDRAPAVQDRVASRPLERPFLTSGPFDWPTRSPVAPGLALVGDAAGYYDPFTGQGVYQAMRGAQLLAEALAGVPTDDRDALDAALRRYARALRRMKRRARAVQRLIEIALSRPERADRVIARLGAAPAVMDALIAVTGDLREPTALLSPRLLSSFLFPPSPEAR